MKFNNDDKVLVSGPGFVEVTTVTDVTGKIVTLKNGIKFNRKTMEASNSKFDVEIYDEERYLMLKSRQSIIPLVDEVKQQVLNGKLTLESIHVLYLKINKALERAKNSVE